MLKIEGWKEHGDGKRTKGRLPWVQLHTDMGAGYCKLMRVHGPEGWGVWTALLMESARHSLGKRGDLRGSLEDLGDLLRIDSDILGRVIVTLKAIGWVSGSIPVSSPGDSQRKSGDPQGISRLHNTTSQDRTVQDRSVTGKAPTDAGVSLAQSLYDAICSHTPDFKADEKKLLGWAKTFDIELRKRGGFSQSEMTAVLEWAHRHDPEGFWHSNLLSAGKVRKHAQKLLIRARNTAKGRGMSTRDLLNDIDLEEGFADA
jgi:hypothetical protein